MTKRDIPEMKEGSEAFERFKDAVKVIIAVPKATVKRNERPKRKGRKR